MRSKPAVLMTFLLGWFLLTLFFDLAGSLTLIDSLGLQVEGNELVRGMLELERGIALLLIAKGAEITGVFAGCLYLYNKARWMGVLGAGLVALTQTYFAVRVLAAFAILGEAFGA